MNRDGLAGLVLAGIVLSCMIRAHPGLSSDRVHRREALHIGEGGLPNSRKIPISRRPVKCEDGIWVRCGSRRSGSHLGP